MMAELTLIFRQGTYEGRCGAVKQMALIWNCWRTCHCQQQADPVSLGDICIMFCASVPNVRAVQELCMLGSRHTSPLLEHYMLDCMKEHGKEHKGARGDA